MTKTTYRRLNGCIVGGLIGLILTLTSMLVRVIPLSNLPLYLPPLGLVVNSLLGMAAGMLLGLVSAWTDSSEPGPIIAAGVGAIAFLLIAFISGQTPLFMVPATLVTTIFLMLPFGAMLLPLTALIRVAVNRWADYRRNSIFQPRRWVWTFLLLAAAFGAGNLFRLSPEAQIMLRREQTLIQAGLQSSSADALPQSLRGPEMADFLGHASPNYELEWQNKNLSLYGIPRPAMPEYEMGVVIAHFDNGWVLVCLYPNTELDPRCRGFDQMPRPTSPY